MNKSSKIKQCMIYVFFKMKECIRNRVKIKECIGNSSKMKEVIGYCSKMKECIRNCFKMKECIWICFKMKECIGACSQMKECIRNCFKIKECTGKKVSPPPQKHFFHTKSIFCIWYVRLLPFFRARQNHWFIYKKQ